MRDAGGVIPPASHPWLGGLALGAVLSLLASFAVSRMRLTKGSLLTNAALLTYAIPASFLFVPYFRIMHSYGLSDNPWAVIAAQVTFATPFAILLLQLYASLIPFELDDAARVDGASAGQVYLRIYLPLMTLRWRSSRFTPCCSPGTTICSRPCCSRCAT